MSQRSRTSGARGGSQVGSGGAGQANARLVQLLLLVLFWGTVSTVHAAEQGSSEDPQPATDPCLVDTLCRGHYDEARQAYKDKRYEVALKEYRAAHERRQAPWLLINIGRTLQRLARLDEALDYYERYLRADPNPKPEVKARVEEYIAQVKAGRETTPKKEPEPGPALVSAPSTNPGPAPAPESRPVYKKWWFWTVIGVVAAGGVAAGVAVALTRDKGTTLPMQPMVPAGVTVYEPKF